MQRLKIQKKINLKHLSEDNQKDYLLLNHLDITQIKYHLIGNYVMIIGMLLDVEMKMTNVKMFVIVVVTK